METPHNTDIEAAEQEFDSTSYKYPKSAGSIRGAATWIATAALVGFMAVQSFGYVNDLNTPSASTDRVAAVGTGSYVESEVNQPRVGPGINIQSLTVEGGGKGQEIHAWGLNIIHGDLSWLLGKQIRVKEDSHAYNKTVRVTEGANTTVKGSINGNPSWVSVSLPFLTTSSSISLDSIPTDVTVEMFDDASGTWVQLADDTDPCTPITADSPDFCA